MTEQTATMSAAPAEGMRWYVVHAYSGMEKVAERNIIERVQRAEMQHQVRSHPGADRGSGRGQERRQAHH